MTVRAVEELVNSSICQLVNAITDYELRITDDGWNTQLVNSSICQLVNAITDYELRITNYG